MTRATLWMLLVIVIGGGLSTNARCEAPTENRKGLENVDVLVFAPHPDDEVLGCGGVIQQALKQNKRIGVVVLTNGDGFPKAAAVIAKKPRAELTAADFLQLAAERQRQSREGLKILGVPGANVWFLAYPDSLLAEIYRSRKTSPHRQRFTEKDQTYAAAVADYHSSVHGRPAPYTRAAILKDLFEIIDGCEPKEIYVTHEADKHADHQAAFWFVRDAARVADFEGRFYTYVVHAGDKLPKLPLRRVSLTAAQVKKKRAAIVPHQIPTVHDTLGEYARDEEIFWRTPFENPQK